MLSRTLCVPGHWESEARLVSSQTAAVSAVSQMLTNFSAFSGQRSQFVLILARTRDSNGNIFFLDWKFKSLMDKFFFENLNTQML